MVDHGEVRIVDGIAVVDAAGELDLRTAPAYGQVLIDQAQTHARVVADLTGVTFLDSSGLAAIVRGAAAARERGGRLVVVASEPRVVRVFELTGLIDVMTVQDSVASATAFLLRDQPSL